MISLTRGKKIPCPRSRLRLWAQKQVQLSCPASERLFSTHRLNLVLTRGLLVFLQLPATTLISSVKSYRASSTEFTGLGKCVPMAVTAESRPPRGQLSPRQLDYGCYLFSNSIDQMMCAPLSPRPLLVLPWICAMPSISQLYCA